MSSSIILSRLFRAVVNVLNLNILKFQIIFWIIFFVQRCCNVAETFYKRFILRTFLRCCNDAVTFMWHFLLNVWGFQKNVSGTFQQFSVLCGKLNKPSDSWELIINKTVMCNFVCFSLIISENTQHFNCSKNNLARINYIIIVLRVRLLCIF